MMDAGKFQIEKALSGKTTKQGKKQAQKAKHLGARRPTVILK
jgi:hypothetical protein